MEYVEGAHQRIKNTQYLLSNKNLLQPAFTSGLSISHLLGREFNQTLPSQWHSCLKSMKPEASVTQRLMPVHNIFPFHIPLEPNGTAKSTFPKQGIHPYCPCTPDLALGHGDCAVKVELYGFFTLVKTGLRISCHPEMSSSWDSKSDRGVGHRKHMFTCTLTAASRVDTGKVARSTPQQFLQKLILSDTNYHSVSTPYINNLKNNLQLYDKPVLGAYYMDDD